jgi:hypothetical protein
MARTRRSTTRSNRKAPRSERRATRKATRRATRKATRSERRATRKAARSERRATRKAARSERRATRKATRTSTRRSRPVVGRKVRRSERVDAVSKILSAAAGVKRNTPARKAKPAPADDVDSFLAGIETSGSYGLKEVFKGDDKGARVAKRGPMKKRKMTPPKIPKNRRGKKIEEEETTGPLDPANIKGQEVNVKRGKNIKAKTKRRGAKKPTAWMEHVKAFYEEKKKEDPDYKYSQALKDAKATYNK